MVNICMMSVSDSSPPAKLNAAAADLKVKVFGVLVGVCVVFLGRWLVFGIPWLVGLCGILSMIGVCGTLGLVGWCVVFYGWRCVVFLFHEISGLGHLIWLSPPG